MKTLKNILLGTTIYLLNIVVVHGNGWQLAGPKNIAGRILAIQVDVKNDQRIYAGAAGGGFWLSTNAGVSWNRSAQFPGSAAVSAITQSNNGTIYVGTGEGINEGFVDPGVVTNNYPYGIKGDGVYKSTDNGVTFQLLPNTDLWEEVNSIAYDNAQGIPYVANEQGLQMSKDGGATFIAANGIPPYVKGISVKVGNNGSVIYSNYNKTSRLGEVFVSTDYGDNFTSVCGAALPQLPNTDIGRISVDVAPHASNVMYALLAKTDGYFAGVYLSKDKGATWREVFPAGGNIDPFAVNWGSYYNAIGVSPIDSSHILLGGTSLYTGKEWSQTNYFTPNLVLSRCQVKCIFYASNGFAYIGTNTGVIKMNIATNSFSVQNGNLSTLQAYTMSVGNDGRIMIGARDNGTVLIRRPNEAPKTGEALQYAYADGRSTVFSMIKSDALFFTGPYGFCYRQASLTLNPQEASEWMGGSLGDTNTIAGRYFYSNIINKRNDKKYTRWHYSLKSADNECGLSKEYANPYVSPLAIWESINDVNTTDTVGFAIDKTYYPGDTICIKSKRNGYPIWTKYEGTDTLRRENNDSLHVKDIVTSRLFIGGSGYKIGGINMGGAPVFMTTNALDFVNPSPFVCVFRTADTTEQVMEMLPSKDGNHLFVLTKRFAAYGSMDVYSIYRVSGFDLYRTPDEMSVARTIWDENAGAGINTPNPRRLLEDNILIQDSPEAILGIALNPQDNNRLVYVTNGNLDRVYEITDAITATDSGTVVSKEGFGIPTGAVYSIIIEMTNSDTAYIGTETGIYKTVNFTGTNPIWEAYNNGINAKVPVFKLLQQTNLIYGNHAVYYSPQGEPTYNYFSGITNYGMIYAATHGLGIFVDSAHWNDIPPYCIPGGKTQNLSMSVYPNPANANVTIDFTIANTNPVSVTIFDIVGRTIMSKSLGNRMIGNYQERIDCSDLSEGFYFITVNAGTQSQSAKIVIRK